MKLNIESLSNKEIKSKDFDLSFDLSSFDFSGVEYQLLSPVHLSGRVSKAGQNFLMKANCNFTFKGSCSRCLCDVEVLVDYDIDAYLMREEYDESEFEDVDVFKIKSYEIDLMEIVESTLCFNVPQRILCSEDCRGICSGCGVNLNTDSCKCEDSIEEVDIDPRFAKLKELLK